MCWGAALEKGENQPQGQLSWAGVLSGHGGDGILPSARLMLLIWERTGVDLSLEELAGCWAGPHGHSHPPLPQPWCPPEAEPPWLLTPWGG